MDRGVSPVPALATTRTAEVARRAVALLGPGGSNSSSSSSHSSNTSMIKAGQARTGEVPVRGISTGGRPKFGRGRIRTPVTTADISHGHHTPATAAVETTRGRRYATHASSGPQDTHLVPIACTTPPGIPLTYVGRKAPSRESTQQPPPKVLQVRPQRPFCCELPCYRDIGR